jgi:hypothetical protein
MPFAWFKFGHIAAMFVAVALEVGAALLLYLIARSGDAPAIRRAFAYTTRIGCISRVCYAVGLIFGVAAGLTGALNRTARWLLVAYALFAVMSVNALIFEAWTRRVATFVTKDREHASSAGLTRLLGRTPIYALSLMMILTLGIVFVMVMKPDPLGMLVS